MKNLNIQLQPSRAPTMDVESTVAALRDVGQATGVVAGVDVTRGDDDGPYVNLTFLTAHPAVLWSSLKPVLISGFGRWASLGDSAIVVCQGDEGWADYLLLHHFDPEEPLDELGADE